MVTVTCPPGIGSYLRPIARLNPAAHFSTINGLKINISKFELIVFGSKQNLRTLPTIKVSCRGTCLTPSSEVRNLGLTFDQHLSWDAHVWSLSRKCCGVLIALSHLRHYLPPQTVPDIVTALVISHIRYCLAVYGNGTAKNLASVQKILNFAARVVSGRRKFNHVSDVRDAPRLARFLPTFPASVLIPSSQNHPDRRT